MIGRELYQQLVDSLTRQAAVGLLGPRQVGKTTLAFEVSQQFPSIYLDLEKPSDRAKLTDPELYHQAHSDKLVILDEIHQMPEIYKVLRGLIDEGRRTGRATGRFLILGSASIDLLRQSGESLAGRMEYLELGPLNLVETAADPTFHQGQLWLRGGFPQSYLASSDTSSLRWRQNFIRTYLQRDIPQFGPRMAATTIERLWTMLAHHQGGLLNASQLASGLGISAPTVTAYIDLLVDLLLVRRLSPWQANKGKRLVKSPKVYIRDSGLVHALLQIRTWDDLQGHPVVGPGWEGFIIENILNVIPEGTSAGFYRTAAGAEIDLVLDFGGQNGLWAIEIKSGLTPRPGRGFHHAIADLQPARSFVVYSGNDRYPLGPGIEAISPLELMQEIQKNELQ
ncbi:MAG: ATP-binding protein [Isosphaeraceae bacterium]